MFRPFRNLLTACRAIRQAVSIYSWMKAVCASVAEFLTRLLTSISNAVTGYFRRTVDPAPKPPKGKSVPERRAVERPLWRRLRQLASTIGFRRSNPAAPTSPTAPRSSNGSSSTSEERADSPRCSSSSTTIRRRGAPRETASSKRSAGSSPRTSTKAVRNDRSRFGAKTNSSRNCRPDSSRPCR